MDKIPISHNRLRAYEVIMTLKPVGATWRIRSLAELRRLCSSILITLDTVHSLGYVHRDIRVDNIVLANHGFVLIDWELAAPSTSPVFWSARAGSHPEGVHKGSSWLPWMDLWQLGSLIESFPPDISRVEAVSSFSDGLKTQKYPSAAKAMEAMDW